MNWEVRTMRSATSCFNSTLYHKTMGRFWPLWTLYGLIWLFFLPLNLINQYFDNLRWGGGPTDSQTWVLDTAKSIPFTLEMGVVLSCIFGALCAMAVFGYLYNNRSAAMMHALPMRRETLFTTQYLAGLSFLLLPHLAVAALTAAAELILLPSAHWGAVLSALWLWLLVQSGTALFFFSFASFCAMFTGHILALPAFYAILNGLVMVLYTLLTQLMAQFFYGLPRDYTGNTLVEYCTPLLTLFKACNMNVDQVTVNGVTSATDQYCLAAPKVVAAYAAVGLIFALLALMIYRYRHVESAGDVVAIPVVRPIFLCGVSFCTGLCLGTLTAAFFGWQSEALSLSLSVLVWTVAGWFAAQMLLKKSFRVFRAWKGCLAMVAALALLCTACFLDLFGVEDRVPDASQVASLTVSGDLGYPYDSGNLRLDNVTDPTQIQRAVNLHQAIVRDKDRADFDSRSYAPGDDYIYFHVRYTMKDGSTLERNYDSVPVYQNERNQEGSVTWQANQLLQDRELVSLSYGFDRYEQKGRLLDAMLDGAYNMKTHALESIFLNQASKADLERLWQAVRQDFDEGTIGVRYLFEDQERFDNTYRTDLVFGFEMPFPLPGRPDNTSSEHLTVTLTPQADNTLALLNELGALGGDYGLALHAGLSPSDPETVPTQPF